MSKKEKYTLKPRLRFPEFQDMQDWKTIKLSSLSKRIVRQVGEMSLTPVSITAGEGFISQEEKFGKNISGSQYNKYILLKRGDFAYNKGNSKKYPQGYICQLHEFKQAAVPNAFICFRLNDEYQPRFFQGMFDENIHGMQLLKYITSGARSDGLLNINPDDFFNMNIPVPPEFAEQQKIADCLSSLDELISNQTQKIDVLKAHKNGVMQQLFPEEGRCAPKARFPEHHNAPNWVGSPIAKICKVFSGGTPDTKKNVYYNGNIPFVRSAEIGRSKTELFLTNDGLINSAAKLIKKGDVLVALYGANSGDVALSRIDGAINQAVLCLTESQCNSFLYHYLSFKKEQIVFTYLQGGQGNLSGDIIKSIILLFPESKEQQKIADCLSSLDDLIVACREKLIELKKFKKSLIQQIFPKIEEVRA